MANNKQDKKPGINVNNTPAVNVNTDVLRQYVTVGAKGKLTLNKVGYVPFILKNAELFGITERADVVRQWTESPICAPVALKDICTRIDNDLKLGRGVDGLNSIIQGLADVCKPLGLSFSDQRGNTGIANAIAAAAAAAAIEARIVAAQEKAAGDVEAAQKDAAAAVEAAQRDARDAVVDGIRTAIEAMLSAGVPDDTIRVAFAANSELVEQFILERDTARAMDIYRYLSEMGINTVEQLKKLFEELAALRAAKELAEFNAAVESAESDNQ